MCRMSEVGDENVELVLPVLHSLGDEGITKSDVRSTMLKITINNNLLYMCIRGFCRAGTVENLPAASVAKQKIRNHPHDIFTLTEH